MRFIAVVVAVVTSLAGFDPNGLPVVNERTITTNAVLTDGQVFTLTGLQHETFAKKKNKFWLLGDIPWLGDALFTRHVQASSKTQLIVILKPHLLALGSKGIEPPTDLMDE